MRAPPAVNRGACFIAPTWCAPRGSPFYRSGWVGHFFLGYHAMGSWRLVCHRSCHLKGGVCACCALAHNSLIQAGCYLIYLSISPGEVTSATLASVHFFG